MTGIFVAFMMMMMRNEKEWWWWRKGMNDDGRLSSIVGSWLLRCSQECGEGRAGFSAVFTRPTGFASNFWQNCRFLFSPKDFPQFSFRLVSPEADLGSAFLDKNILWLNFKLALTIRIVSDACCIIRSKNVFKRFLFLDVFVEFRITQIGFVLSRQNWPQWLLDTK